jgi:hypothetical protein
MKLAGIKTGLLMNFNVTKLKTGSRDTLSETFVLFVSFVVSCCCGRVTWSDGTGGYRIRTN